jgi:hypothetical protein
MNVVGDDKQAFVARQGAGHFFRGRANIDEQRAVVGNERCRRGTADHLLFVSAMARREW